MPHTEAQERALRQAVRVLAGEDAEGDPDTWADGVRIGALYRALKDMTEAFAGNGGTS